MRIISPANQPHNGFALLNFSDCLLLQEILHDMFILSIYFACSSNNKRVHLFAGYVEFSSLPM